MSQKRKRTEDEDGEHPPANTAVFRSQPLEDRKSTFVGIFSPTLTPTELQGLAEIQNASHKILAWRKQSNQQSITKATRYVTGSDDDGEKYAGRKVENILNALQIIGSCVVARWYGGVLLGPVRFSHIESVAKEAVQKWLEAEDEGRQKKQKIEKDEAETALISRTLVERDQSISVLRVLAAEKEMMLNQAQKSKADNDNGQTDASELKAAGTNTAIDYASMPLDRLKVLERARDATLTFLLKRIDKAESDLSALQSASEKPP